MRKRRPRTADRSSASRNPRRAQPRGGKLAFEALEPRIALNAAYVGLADSSVNSTNAGLLLVADLSDGQVAPWRAPFVSLAERNAGLALAPGEGISGLAFNAAGNLLASTDRPGGLSDLLTMDPNTGAILSRVPIRSGATPISIGDLAVLPGPAFTLIGLRSGDDGGNAAGQLFVIDASTGAATPWVNAPATPATLRLGDGLAFATDGTLYVSGLDSSTGQPKLFVRESGGAERMVTLSARALGLDVRASDGVLLATRLASNNSQPNMLATVNTQTGLLSTIALTAPLRGTGGDVALRPMPAGADFDVFYRESFEASDGGYTADNTGGFIPGMWHYSIGRHGDGNINHTPQHNWYYGLFEGATGGGRYDTLFPHRGVLSSPVIQIPDCGTSVASFSYLLDTREITGQDCVEVYVDTGIGSPVLVLQREETLPQTGNRWQTATLDLSAFAGQSIRLQFLFDTKGSVPIDPEGWYVDDVVVANYCAPQADLAITKTDGVTDAVPGSTNSYTIVVSNAGPGDVAGARVTDTFASNFTNVTYMATATGGASGFTPSGSGNIDDLVNLPAGSSITYMVTGTILASATGTLTNTVCVEIPAGLSDPNDADDGVLGQECATDTTDLTPRADLEIVSKADTPDPVIAGNELTYTIEFVNRGPSDAQTVTVTDAVPANTTFVSAAILSGAGWSIAAPSVGSTGDIVFSKPTVATSETASFQIVVRVAPSTPDGTMLSNTATAASPTPDPDTTNNSKTQPTEVGTLADLEIISKADTPDPVIAGNELTYTVEFANRGPSDAQTVTVTDAVPANTTFVSAAILSGTGWTLTAPSAGGTGNVVFSKGSVAANETASFRIVVRVNPSTPDGTMVSNTATAASPTPDPDTTNNSKTQETDVDTLADLEIVSKADTPDPVIAGNELVYTIEFVNRGPSDAQTVTVTDAVPPNTTFVSAAILSGTGWTITAPSVGGTGNVVFSKGAVPANETASFQIVVRVNTSAPDGSMLSNTATAASPTPDQDPTNNSKTQETTVEAEADLEIISKLDSPDPVLAAGDLTYTISFVNRGPSDAQTVTVTDAVPANTTFISAAILTGAGWTLAAPAAGGTGNIVFSKGMVAADETATFQILVRVNPSTPMGTLLTNTATAASTTPDPDNTNNSKTQTTTVQSVTISGTKFNDRDGDGVRDADDIGLAGWVIQLDIGADGAVDLTATTDASGNYSFANLGLGTYRLREVQQPGWVQTTANPADIVVAAGMDVANVNFGNKPADQVVQFITPLSAYRVSGPFYRPPDFNVAIAGFVWHDTNNDGDWDAGEPGLNGVMVYVDIDNDNIRDPGEPAISTTNDGNPTNPRDGAYWFEALQFSGSLPGTFVVRVELPPGQQPSFPGTSAGFEHSLQLAENAPVTAGFQQTAAPNFGLSQNFVNAPPAGRATIIGFLWHDVDQDGRWDRLDTDNIAEEDDDLDEPGRPGWLVYVDTDNNQRFDPEEPFAITDRNGRYTLANLPQGTHIIREDLTDLSNGTFVVQRFPPPAPTQGFRFEVDVGSGQVRAATFGATAALNFGRFEYSPFIRPADDHFGNLDANHNGRIEATESGQHAFVSLRSWQSFSVSNTLDVELEITSIDTSSLGADAAFLRILRLQADGVWVPVNLPAEPVRIAAGASAEFLAFYDPAIRQDSVVLSQSPDWYDQPATPTVDESSSRPPHTFALEDRLRVETRLAASSLPGPTYDVLLVGGSTFDSDIVYDGSVDGLDFERLMDLLDRQWPIVAGDPLFDPTSDMNARLPNGAGGVFNTDRWPIGGPPPREIGLGDFVPLNIELDRARAPFLDLDTDNSSGVRGTGFQTEFVSGGVAIADFDARFANILDLALVSLQLTIVGPLDGAEEDLTFTPSGAITGQSQFTAGRRVLTLSGSDTVENYLAVLQSVRYVNGSTSPQPGTRTIHIVATGGSEFQVVFDQRAGNTAVARVTVNPPAQTAAALVLMAAEEDQPIASDTQEMPADAVAPSPATEPASDAVQTGEAAEASEPQTSSEPTPPASPPPAPAALLKSGAVAPPRAVTSTSPRRTKPRLLPPSLAVEPNAALKVASQSATDKPSMPAADAGNTSESTLRLASSFSQSPAPADAVRQPSDSGLLAPLPQSDAADVGEPPDDNDEPPPETTTPRPSPASTVDAVDALFAGLGDLEDAFG